MTALFRGRVRGAATGLGPTLAGWAARGHHPLTRSSGRPAGLAAGLVVAVVVVTLTGCSPQALLVRSAADQLAGVGAATEDDPVLAKEASAFYLKLSESVLARNPGHLPLAAAVAGGFTQYAYAFVAFEAERLENTDARAALRHRQRAARLYARAKGHALRALEQRHPGLLQALATPTGSAAALKLAADEASVAYWAAAAWGGQIALSKDQPDTVADLPLAIRLAEQAWQAQPLLEAGGLAGLMGQFELARPGGTPERAAAYFDQAVQAGGGQQAGPWVAKAEALALPAGDRAQFEAWLRVALRISQAHPTLANQVMRDRATWLLDTAEDRF